MQNKGKNKKKLNLFLPGFKSKGPQRWRQAGTLATASPLLFTNYLLNNNNYYSLFPWPCKWPDVIQKNFSKMRMIGEVLFS